MWLVRREVDFARQRINNQTATEVVATELMLVKVLMGGGDAAKQYRKLIDRLQGD